MDESERYVISVVWMSVPLVDIFPLAGQKMTAFKTNILSTSQQA